MTETRNEGHPGMRETPRMREIRQQLHSGHQTSRPSSPKSREGKGGVTQGEGCGRPTQRHLFQYQTGGCSGTVSHGSTTAVKPHLLYLKCLDF